MAGLRVRREDLFQLVEQAAQGMALDLPAAHPGSGQGAPQQDDHLGMRGTELLQPRHLVFFVGDQGQRGPVARHHCIACQCARIFWVSAPGVSPVSTSPALLIADQVPPSAQKPW